VAGRGAAGLNVSDGDGDSTGEQTRDDAGPQVRGLDGATGRVDDGRRAADPPATARAGGERGAFVADHVAAG
jgi:hypothetical protein